MNFPTQKVVIPWDAMLHVLEDSSWYTPNQSPPVSQDGQPGDKVEKWVLGMHDHVNKLPMWERRYR